MAETQPPRPGPSPPPGKRRAGPGKLLWRGAAIVLLVAAGFYIWQERSERRVLDERTSALLRLAALPLGFAVRSAAIDLNLGEIDAYFDQLAAEPGVQRVVYADAGGTVRVSTDQAVVGRPLSQIFPRLDLEVDRTEVVREDARYHAVVPITGLNERLGVVVLTYAAEAPAREDREAR